jgi:hypothetical protein
VLLIVPVAAAAFMALDAREVGSDDRLSAVLFSAAGLVTGIVTACGLYWFFSSRGITEAPEQTRWEWAMFAAIASVPAWEDYLTPLPALVFIGAVGSFVVTAAWLYRERAGTDSGR